LAPVTPRTIASAMFPAPMMPSSYVIERDNSDARFDGQVMLELEFFKKADRVQQRLSVRDLRGGLAHQCVFEIRSVRHALEACREVLTRVGDFQ
jgi:hypothetical protein